MRQRRSDATAIVLSLAGILCSLACGMGQAQAPATAASPAAVKSPAVATVTREKDLSDREKVMRVAFADINVVEKTGNNDGVRVEQYLANTGLKKGNPYCAAAVVTWYLEALGSLPKGMPRSAMAADMVRQPTWKQGKGAEPRPADCFGIWIGKDVHHTGLVAESFSNRIKTMEANTSPNAAQGTQADRDAAKGGGCFSKIRYKTTIFSIKSWLP